MDNPLAEGMIVRNPKAPDWGIGKILKLEPRLAHVRFVGRSEPFKVQLAVLEPAESQVDPFPKERKSKSPYSSKTSMRRHLPDLDHCIERFMRWYPLGFDDPTYLGKERDYKLATRGRLVDVVGDGRARDLLDAGRADDLATQIARAVWSEGYFNLLSKFETMAFRQALDSTGVGQAFLPPLLAVLDDPAVTEKTFEPFLRAVRALPKTGSTDPDKWTIATSLPFIAQPARHMFLKPNPTKDAATRLRFELPYSPDPNWLTYEKLLLLSDEYLKLLSPKGAKDLIDVQSFWWLSWRADHAGELAE